MTYPITPDPSIHSLPPAVAQSDQDAAVAQLRATFAKLPLKIVEGLVDAILTALGATPAQIAAANTSMEDANAAVNLLLSNLNTDFGKLQDDSIASGQAFATLLHSWWTTATTSGLTWAQEFEALDAAWSTYVANNSDIVADEWATLTDIFDLVLGIDPTTGQLSFGKLPATYANIGPDFNKLVNDLLNAFGGGWSNVGADLEALVEDITGQPHTSSINALQQISPSNIGSTGSSANLGVDVGNAQGAATSAGNDAATIASQVSAVVNPLLPAAPTWLWVVEVPVTSGHPGVGVAGDDVWYRVTAINGAGESIGSNAVYAHAWIGPIGNKLTWNGSSGATSYRVYRGIASDSLIIFPSEPALTQYVNVGNVTTWTDMGD